MQQPELTKDATGVHWLAAGCTARAGFPPPQLRSRRGGAWGGSGPFVCSPAPPRPHAGPRRAADTSG